MFFFFFQAEDGIRDAQESRGLGDVYKRQGVGFGGTPDHNRVAAGLLQHLARLGRRSHIAISDYRDGQAGF